ncbi:MAG: insulinase family protein, partial [Verrucomicrobiae bacterium]|nr:insulinase family protein [Verrucomicrobiae bacterium]
FGVSAHALSTDVECALALLADVLQNPTFPEEMLAREREVQLAEIKSEQDQILPAAQQLLRETLYKRHPYRLNINGKLETVSQLTRDDLVAFHQRYVVASNLVLAVFGNVQTAHVQQLAQKYFGAIPPRTAEFPTVAAEYLEQPARAEATKPKEQAVLLLGFHSADLFSPDRYALELLDEAYSGMGSRLFRRLRDELGLCYYVGAYQQLGLHSGYFVFYVGTSPQNLRRCEEEFFAELAKLGTEGLSSAELARAQNSLIGQRRIHMQDNAELSQMVALDELYGLGYDFYRQMETHYRAVTMADIQRLARNYFADRPFASAVERPDSAKE